MTKKRPNPLNEQNEKNAHEQPTSAPLREEASTRSVRSLTPEQRQVIRELREEGHSYSEIASTIGCSKSTAHTIAKDVKPLTRHSEGTKLNKPSTLKPNATQVNVAQMDPIERMRQMSKLPRSEIIAYYEHQLRGQQTNSPYQNPGASPLRQTIPNLLASRLAGAQDRAYLEALGVDVGSLFGSSKRHDSETDTSTMLKQMREFSMTIAMLEKMGTPKTDPFLQQLRTEQKSLMDKYESLRDAQHKAEVKRLEDKVEQVRAEKNELEKVKDLLKGADPALAGYIRTKLGLGPKENIVDHLEKLGLNLKDVWSWIKEFMDKIKLKTAVVEGPPPPPSAMPSVGLPPPDEGELPEIPQDLYRKPSTKMTFGEFEEPEEQVPPEETHLPPEEEAEEPEASEAGKGGGSMSEIEKRRGKRVER